MLAQMLIELSKIADWQTQGISDYYEHKQLPGDVLAVSEVVNAAGQASTMFTAALTSKTSPGNSDLLEPTAKAMADVALLAIVALHHFTGDVSQTGAVLIERMQSMTRHMVNAQVAANRYAARQSPEAMALQRQFNDATRG